MDKDAVEPVQNHWASSNFLGSKTTQLLETYSRSEQTKPFGGHQYHPPIRGVGYLNRFQGRLLPYTNTGTVQEISEISCPGSDIPVQSSAFRSVYSTHGVHCSNKGVETDGHTQGYKDPPIPRRLVGESQIPPGLSPPHSRSSENMPRTRLAGEFRKIRTGTKASLPLCHLNERTARGAWSLPESKLHINYLKLRAVFLALKDFQDLCLHRIVLVATDNTTVVPYINKEGGRRSGPPCALLWRILTWCTRDQLTLKARHIPGWLNVVADKLSRLGQTIQTEWSPSGGLTSYMQEVAPASNRRICHEVQQQVAFVCVTGTRSPGHCSECTQSAMGGSGCICLQTSSHLGQSGGEVAGLPMQENHSDCSGVAQHALFVGPSGHVQSDPTEPVLAQPVNTALQSDPSEKSDKPKSPSMAPRAISIKKQGFSEAVAARIEAPQRGSTRSVYEARWTIFFKWCVTNQVDLWGPPVKSVADFLMYLLQDRKLQPGTIDGYRSLIADKLGNSHFNICKDENLTRLLDSFH